MKKLIAILVACLTIFSICACNSNDANNNNSNSNSSTSSSLSSEGTDSKSSSNSSESLNDSSVEQSSDTSKSESISLPDDNTPTKIMMSVLGESGASSCRMRFDSTITPYVSTLNSKKYQNGDFKPVWQELQKRLDFCIIDMTPQNISNFEQAYQKLESTSFNSVNILNSISEQINNDALKTNSFVDLTKYKSQLPNYFTFLEQNDFVKKSVTASDGAIYFTPSLNGYDELDKTFICRNDWVEKLLDDEITEYKTNANGTKNITKKPNNPTFDTLRTLSANLSNLNGTNKAYYNGFYDSMNTSFTAMKSANETQKITISYNSGEGIIAQQNAISVKNGKNLTAALKSYIQKHYITPGYITKPSELFCGQKACYNADELIALWRCIYTNPALLTGDSSSVVVPFYPTSRNACGSKEVLQLVQLWGVRGYDSNNNYLYFDEQGKLADARVSDDMLQGLTFLNQLYNEGLILNNYQNNFKTQKHLDYLNTNNLGFMTYNNQDATNFNETINDTQTLERNLASIMFPVADWDNKASLKSENTYAVNGDNTLYQYTESWRSVSKYGWAITTNTEKNTNKLRKCLEILDYMYTDAGQRLMTFGPDEWLETDQSGEIETIDYKGKQIPKINEKALAEINSNDVGKHNTKNYYQQYVGSMFPIGYVKEAGIEAQTDDEFGKKGLESLENAVNYGVLKHATIVENTQNKQNAIVPAISLSLAQESTVKGQAPSLFSEFDNNQNGKNIFHDYVLFGFSNLTANTKSQTELKELIINYGMNAFLTTYQQAYGQMLAR